MTKLLLAATDEYILMNGMYFRIFTGRFYGRAMYFPIPTVLVPEGQDMKELTPEFLKHVAYEFPPNKITSLLPAKRNEEQRHRDRVGGCVKMGTTTINPN